MSARSHVDTTTDASLLDETDISSEYRDVNGVRLHVVGAGAEDDPLVVLLHGFPEFWYCWHRSIDRLVEAGYRVLVPDQRGYNLSEKPEGVRPYRIDELSGDVVGLIDSAGRESAHVVGHDWGGLVAWDLGRRHPGAVNALGVVNMPHPAVLGATLKSNLRQTLKSWYMYFFQLPRVPEWSLRRNNFELLADGFDSTEAGTFTDADLDRYRAAWDRERGVTGMANWYRALFRYDGDPPGEGIDAPTLVVWGDDDEYLLSEMASRSLEYCEDGRLERIPGGSHWVHHERPRQVTDLLVDHLYRPTPREARP